LAQDVLSFELFWVIHVHATGGLLAAVFGLEIPWMAMDYPADRPPRNLPRQSHSFGEAFLSSEAFQTWSHRRKPDGHGRTESS